MISLVAIHKYTTKCAIIVPLAFESIRQPLLQDHFRYSRFTMSILQNLAVVTLLNWFLDTLAQWPWCYLSGTKHTEKNTSHSYRNEIMVSLWLTLGLTVCMLVTLGGVFLVVVATHIIFDTSDSDRLGNVTFPMIYLIIGALRMSSIWIVRQLSKTKAAKPLDQPKQSLQTSKAMLTVNCNKNLESVDKLQNDETRLFVETRLHQIESQYVDLKQDLSQILELQQQPGSTPVSTETSPHVEELLYNINANMSRLLENGSSTSRHSHPGNNADLPASTVNGDHSYNYQNLDEDLGSVPLFPFSPQLTSPALRDKRDSFFTDDETVFEGMHNEKPEESMTAQTSCEVMFEPWRANVELNSTHELKGVLEGVEGSNDRMYSLHGLPLTSSINRLITRNTQHPTPTNEFFPHKDSNSISPNESLTEVIYCIINAWVKHVSVSKFLQDPSGVIINYHSNVQPHLVNYYNQKISKYTAFTLLIKRVVWEYFYHHILAEATSPLATIVAIHAYTKHLAMKIGYPFILVFVLLPWNFFRTWVSIVIFVPRILFRIFVMLPLAKFWETRRMKKEFTTLQKSNSRSTQKTSDGKEFPGMKKFRLSSSNRVHQLKASRLVVEKLAEHCNSDRQDYDFKYAGEKLLYPKCEIGYPEPVQMIYNSN